MEDLVYPFKMVKSISMDDKCIKEKCALYKRHSYNEPPDGASILYGHCGLIKCGLNNC